MPTPDTASHFLQPFSNTTGHISSLVLVEGWAGSIVPSVTQLEIWLEGLFVFRLWGSLRMLRAFLRHAAATSPPRRLRTAVAVSVIRALLIYLLFAGERFDYFDCFDCGDLLQPLYGDVAF